MRRPALLAALALLVTAMVVLVLFDDGGSIGGLSSDQLARTTQLVAIALVIGSGLFATRTAALARFRQALVWLAVVLALVVGYIAYTGQA